MNRKEFWANIVIGIGIINLCALLIVYFSQEAEAEPLTKCGLGFTLTETHTSSGLVGAVLNRCTGEVRYMIVDRPGAVWTWETGNE